MDMYAEHGYILYYFFTKLIYIKLAFRDYFFVMRQKKILKKTPTYGTVFAFHTPSTRCN